MATNKNKLYNKFKTKTNVCYIIKLKMKQKNQKKFD